MAEAVLRRWALVSMEAEHKHRHVGTSCRSKSVSNMQTTLQYMQRCWVQNVCCFECEFQPVQGAQSAKSPMKGELKWGWWGVWGCWLKCFLDVIVMNVCDLQPR